MKQHRRLSAFALTCVLLTGTFCGCADKGGTPAGGAGEAPGTEPPRPLYTGRTAPVIEKAQDVEPTAEKFSVSRAFSSNMILQRDDYIRI